MDDFANALDKLKGMMSTSEGQDQLQNIIGMFAGNAGNAADENNTESVQDQSRNRTAEPETEPVSGGNSAQNSEMQTMLKMQNIMSMLNSGGTSNSHAQFLNALKPYLKEERKAKVDSAIKILGFSKIAGIMKDII